MYLCQIEAWIVLVVYSYLCNLCRSFLIRSEILLLDPRERFASSVPSNLNPKCGKINHQGQGQTFQLRRKSFCLSVRPKESVFSHRRLLSSVSIGSRCPSGDLKKPQKRTQSWMQPPMATIQSLNQTQLSGTLSPLTDDLHKGLIPVTLFGILSFSAASCLFLLLTFRMVRWNLKERHINQFVILIWNLLLADIQQSMSFLLNAKWLVENQINVESSACWAQAWFVSTGDLASGVWSFAIGAHTFAVVIFDYRLSNIKFLVTVFMLWSFVYVMALIGIAMHPSDYYVRASAWCWVCYTAQDRSQVVR